MTDDSEEFERAARNASGLARLDLRICRAVAPYEDLPSVRAIAKASELADQPPMIAASLAVLAAGLASRNARVTVTGLRMLAAHAAATGAKTIIKNNFDRTRPEKVLKDGKHRAEPGSRKDGDYRSLPSGHTAGAVAVARAIGREYPRSRPIGYGLAAMAALVQIPKKAHFPSDVALGAVIGLAAEALVDRMFRGRA